MQIVPAVRSGVTHRPISAPLSPLSRQVPTTLSFPLPLVAVSLQLRWLHSSFGACAECDETNKQQQQRDALAAEQFRPPATAPPESSPTGSTDYSESFATVISPPTDLTFVSEQIQAYHSQITSSMRK